MKKSLLGSTLFAIFVLTGCSSEVSKTELEEATKQLQEELAIMHEENAGLHQESEASKQEKTEFSSALLYANVFMKALAEPDVEKLTDFSNGLLVVEDVNRLGFTQPNEDVVEIFNEEKHSLAEWTLRDYSYSNEQPVSFEFYYGVNYLDANGAALMEDTIIILKMQKIDQEWKVVDVTN